MRESTKHAGIAVLLALLAPAARADLTHFYCYAPDPVSGTVYVSSTLPVGPVSERRGYGQEFVDHLKKTGRLKADVASYCVMRDGADQVARSRAALPIEGCSECGGVTRFADVAWSRNGVSMRTAPIVPVVHSELHPAVVVESPPAKAPVDVGPTLVVLGNVETGKLLVVSHQPNLEKAARAQAKAVRETGWTTLVSTREIGYGAATCVQDAEETRFFYAHGKENARDAIRAAREQAEAFAATRGGTVRVCGSPWYSSKEAFVPPKPDAMDLVKGVIRKQVTCDRTGKDPERKCRQATPPSDGSPGVRG